METTFRRAPTAAPQVFFGREANPKIRQISLSECRSRKVCYPPGEDSKPIDEQAKWPVAGDRFFQRLIAQRTRRKSGRELAGLSDIFAHLQAEQRTERTLSSPPSSFCIRPVHLPRQVVSTLPTCRDVFIEHTVPRQISLQFFCTSPESFSTHTPSISVSINSICDDSTTIRTRRPLDKVRRSQTFACLLPSIVASFIFLCPSPLSSFLVLLPVFVPGTMEVTI